MAEVHLKNLANRSKKLGEKIILNLSSKLFQPLNIIPQNSSKTSEVLSKSHRLMINTGIIRPASAGTYHLLPLGIRSLNKLRNIVKYEMSTLFAQEIRLPFLIDYKLWLKSGRSNANFGFFKLQDRHGRELLLSPTGEESVTDLMASIPQLSQNNLPILVYQISTKFRDELKPRCGLIKTKEFEMKDLYSFDKSLLAAELTYKNVNEAYKRIFKTVEVPVIRAEACTGDMQGIYSHEYHIINELGEDNVRICKNCSNAYNPENLNASSSCKNCESKAFLNVKGIEIGHTFLLGSFYTESMKALFKTSSNMSSPLAMACYGFGLTRFISAATEYLSSENELKWPKHLAPFNVCIIPPKDGSKEFDVGNKLARDLYLQLNEMPHLYDDILLDDRGKLTIGKKLLLAKQTGYPYIIVLGSKITDDSPLIEFHDRRINIVKHLSYSELVSLFSEL